MLFIVIYQTLIRCPVHRLNHTSQISMTQGPSVIMRNNNSLITLSPRLSSIDNHDSNYLPDPGRACVLTGERCKAALHGGQIKVNDYQSRRLPWADAE
jgi:hypothetical protein